MKSRLLVEHTADHYEIGPAEESASVSGSGVTVDETDVPMLRQHGGDCDQAEGGAAGYFAPISSQASV